MDLDIIDSQQLCTISRVRGRNDLHVISYNHDAPIDDYQLFRITTLQSRGKKLIMDLEHVVLPPSKSALGLCTAVSFFARRYDLLRLYNLQPEVQAALGPLDLFYVACETLEDAVASFPPVQ